MIGKTTLLPKAAMSWFEGFENSSRVGESIMACMCECDIANTKGVVLSQGGERVAKLMSTVQHTFNSMLHGGTSQVDRTYPSTPSRLATFPRRKREFDVL